MLKLLSTIAFVGLLFCCQTTRADFKVKKTSEVSVGLFSGAGVVFYSITSNEVGIQASACAGVKVGGEMMGVGAVEKAQICVDWEISAKPKKKPANREEQLKVLEDVMNSDESKMEFVKAFRKELKKASDDDLKAIGVKRSDIDKIEGVKFAPVEDKTDQKTKIIDILKGCTPLKPMPNT